MGTASPGFRPATTGPNAAPGATARVLARCLDCGGRPLNGPGCPECGRPIDFRDGILEAIGPLSGRNRIVAAFYDGPGWRRFEPWERGFLLLQGGERRARMEALRHVVAIAEKRPVATVLEVGIGAGANLRHLPGAWTVHGVDIARSRLVECVRRRPEMFGRLAHAEAEALPFDDDTFDACFSLGGFTYFRDHAAALREMRRVVRPDGPVVVGDEISGLHRAGLGHLLGAPRFDAWWLRGLGLDREFVDMALGFDVDLDAVVSQAWPGAVRHRIWHGLGYCYLNIRKDPQDPSRPKDRVESGEHPIEFERRCTVIATGQEHSAVSRWEEIWDVWRCPSCRGRLRHDGPEALNCAGCGERMPIEEDLLVIKARSSDNNGVAQTFYDGPLWPKFRFWEKFTWFCNGGERRARNAVLKYLPRGPKLDLLDIAIGDGVYLEWLPPGWRIAGVDISKSQLDVCRRRAAGRPVWLAQCEAEDLPLADQAFDAVLSIGAFNYFNDPEKALREMARVARPGAPIVVSDEMPNLTDRMLGHKLGVPGMDRWIVSRMMHLGDAFTEMVEQNRALDVPAIAGRVFKDFRFEPVWRGVGYVLVGTAAG